MNNDQLANVLSAIDNAEKVSKAAVTREGTSTVVTRVLEVLKAEGYVNGYNVENDGKGGILTIELGQSINKIGSIKPRFAVKANGFQKFEKRYLPADGFGIIIVSTPQGIMTHNEAKKHNTGGKLLAYCY
jgi:small subunit ribosomal protein S8